MYAAKKKTECLCKCVFSLSIEVYAAIFWQEIAHGILWPYFKISNAYTYSLVGFAWHSLFLGPRKFVYVSSYIVFLKRKQIFMFGWETGQKAADTGKEREPGWKKWEGKGKVESATRTKEARAKLFRIIYILASFWFRLSLSRVVRLRYFSKNGWNFSSLARNFTRLQIDAAPRVPLLKTILWLNTRPLNYV